MGKMDTNIQSKMDGMNNKMDGNALEAKNLMKKEMKEIKNGMKEEMRGEMQSMGLNFRAGQKAVSLGIRGIIAPARGEIRAVECKMAAPRGRGTEPASELREECGLCRLRGGGQNNSGDALGETRAGDGKSDGDTEGKIKRGD